MTAVNLLLRRRAGASLSIQEVSYFAGLKGDAFSAFSAGDLCVLMTSNGGNNTTAPTLLSGWTNITSHNSASPTHIAARIQAKILSPGDSATSAPAGTRIAGAILRGVGLTDLVDSDVGSVGAATGLPYTELTETGLDFILAFATFRSDQAIIFPTGFTPKASKLVGSGAPISAVACSADSGFAGQTVTHPASISGAVSFTVGVRAGG